MINFLDLKQVDEMVRSLERMDEKYFAPITFSNYTIQLGAGAKAFSTPQLYFGRIVSYQNVEMTFSETIKDQMQIIAPYIDERFNGFSWAKYFNYEKFNYHQKKKYLAPSHIGANIPLKDVSTIVREIYKVSRLKMFF